MKSLVARLLGVRGRNGRGRRAVGSGTAGRHRRGSLPGTGERPGELVCGRCTPCGGWADVEEPAPASLRLRYEAVHGMMEGESESAGTALVHSRTKKNFGLESKEEKRMRRLWEKQQQAQGMQAVKQMRASMLYAKRQILEANSTSDLLERAENLIEEDWLGKIEEMPGNMFSIGAFGDLTHGADKFTVEGLKLRARLVGCIVIALIQLLGPPAVFFSTLFGWGVKKDHYFHWENWTLDKALSDWQRVKVTKTLGLLFMFCFILNGLFVALDNKQSWFKIYNIFQYLKRSTPNFELHGTGFLYAGAFINCWTVLWCCVSSYVVIGASESPQDLLMDSLGMLFLYNLDDIGGELGFVDEDDWPGVRLGWIHAEMVKKDWAPGDEEEPGEVEDDYIPCVKGCGRRAAPGIAENGRKFDTCCRGCALGEAHEPECNARAKADEEKSPSPLVGESSYVAGETADWEVGGFVMALWFNFTVGILMILSVALPVLTTFTPFLLIAPEDN